LIKRDRKGRDMKKAGIICTGITSFKVGLKRLIFFITHRVSPSKDGAVM